MSRVRGRHHVLSIEHLLSELRDADSAELLAATGSKGSEADHEEVETGERNKVDSHLSEIRVELTRELQDKHVRIVHHCAQIVSQALTRRDVETPLMTTETRWLRSP